MDTNPKMTLEMHTLLLCCDPQFLGTTRGVLHALAVTPKTVAHCEAALAQIESHAFDVIVVDWREIDNLAEFLGAVRRSKLNPDCVLVAIVRDLLDLRQAFAAGVHFLIHKPASVVQIERCLRAAYSATVTRRRKQHREPVRLPASVSTRMRPFTPMMVVNLSERGMGLAITNDHGNLRHHPTAGDEIEVRFTLPKMDAGLHVTGRVVWTTSSHCGVRFSYVPEGDRQVLEQWLTECVERSLAETCERLRAACA